MQYELNAGGSLEAVSNLDRKEKNQLFKHPK